MNNAEQTSPKEAAPGAQGGAVPVDFERDGARAPAEPFADVEGMRGRILTAGVRRTVFVLALPVLCEQFLSFLVGFYDTFLSGRIGAAATAAIGVAAYTGWLASMLFSLVGTGTVALVSRHWGAAEFTEASRVVSRSVALAALLGCAFCAFLWGMAPAFAHLLGMDGETAAVAVRYLRLDAVGHLFTAVSLVGAAALRGTGDMRTPMLVLGMVSVVNVLVSTALVFGVGPVEPWGIDGIVAGTVVARFCGGGAMLAVLLRGDGSIRLLRGECKLRDELVRRILRVGLPAALDGAIVWAGQLVFLVIIAHLEQEAFARAAFAAHVVGVQVEAVMYLPAVAWGVAAATMVGQSLGARNPQRALRAGHEAARQCGLLAVAVSAAFFTGARLVYESMHTDPAVQAVGIPAFRLMAMFQLPSALWLVYTIALRGAGDTRTVLLINAAGISLRLPVAYLCGIHWGGGLFGAWIGMYADITLRCALACTRFSRGRWSETRV